LHTLEFEEYENGEGWTSSTIPFVYPDPEMVSAADAEGERNRNIRVSELRQRHPGVWLVHLFKERLEESSGAPLPLPKEVLESLLAPCSPEELATFSSEKGRQGAFVSTRQVVESGVQSLARLEQEALDGGLGIGAGLGQPAIGAALPLTPTERTSALLALAAERGALVESLRALRAVCLAHTARLDALGHGEERAAAESKWIATLGLTPGSNLPTFRSKRIPSELWEGYDDPLGQSLTASEAAASGLSSTGNVTRAMMMEHRDRVEFLSRAKLPTPLHSGAPTPLLEAAARTLDSNPSLSPEDKLRMLSAYSAGLEEADEAWDLSHVTKVIKDPQPQWGWYDPEVVKLQDAANDAMMGRGVFSSYRGNAWRDELLPPAQIGLPPPLHVQAGTPETPLETMEEVEALGKEMDRRAVADSLAATAAITAAIEKSMGLRPRNAGAKGEEAAHLQNFFKRYAAGQRPAPEIAAPPAGGHRVEVERKELEMGAGVKGKGKDKGGKKK